MRKSAFDVVDTLLHDLSASTSVTIVNHSLSTCRDTTSESNCACGGNKPKPKPKPKPKAAHRGSTSARVRVKD